MDILKLFAGRTLLDIVVIILVLSASLVYLIKKGNVSKIGSVTIGGTNKAPPHATCPHSRDILEILSKQSEYINNVRDIRQSVIPQQMRFMDSKSIETRGIMQKTFLALQEKITNDHNIPQVETFEYQTYKTSLRIVHQDMREYFLECFRENHLADKSESEYRAYAEMCANEIIQNTTDILNDLYRGSIVTRSIIFEENKTILSKLRENIIDVYNHARAIAIKAEQDIKHQKDAFDTYFTKKFSGDNK